MTSFAILRKLCAVTLCIMVAAQYAEAVINCGMITQNLAPCLGFLMNGEGPPAACCKGVKNLQNLASTLQDRKAACQCMKAAAASFPEINHKNSAALPKKCGVSIPGVVGPQTDCSKIH